MVEHHPPDEILAGWSSGTTDEAEGLLVATHLALCPRCRAVVDGLDALGGALLEASAAEAPPADLEALLARLDEPEPRAAAPAPLRPDDLPLPLRAITGPLDRIPFKRKAPGIWRYDLPLSTPSRPVCLISLRPRLRIPAHLHAGVERGLVLTGGYTDETGHFTRGDVQYRTPEETDPHRQRIDPGDRCVVLMVEDGPKVPTNLLGRVVVRLFEGR